MPVLTNIYALNGGYFMQNISVKSSCELLFSKTNGLEEILSTAKRRAPYGKIALLTIENDLEFLEYITELKKQGNKVLTLTFSQSAEFSVDNVCGLFTLHEDIRFIIAHQSLFSFAYYFASLRNIPCLTVVSKLSQDYFQRELFVKNGRNMDKVRVDCERIVVTNGSLGLEELTALVIEKKLNLFEYYAKRLFLRQYFDRKKVVCLLDVLDQINNFIQRNDIENAYKNFARLICYENESGGEIFSFNIPNVCENILKSELSVQKRLLIYKVLYDKISKGIDNIEPPDYNGFAKRIEDLFKIDNCAQFVKNNVDALSIVTEKEKLEFYKAFEIANKYLSNIIKISKNKLSEKEKCAIEIAGYAFFGVNLATITNEMVFIK